MPELGQVRLDVLHAQAVHEDHRLHRGCRVGLLPCLDLLLVLLWQTTWLLNFVKAPCGGRKTQR